MGVVGLSAGKGKYADFVGRLIGGFLAFSDSFEEDGKRVARFLRGRIAGVGGLEMEIIQAPW